MAARVFIVDDEQVIASSLATIPKLHGYCATSFTSPIEALTAAWSRAPDLLISDVVMPGLSEVDLAIQIKAECPECKVLLFSGQAATKDLLKDARRHGHYFQLLQKPLHPSDMLASIRALSAAGPIPVAPVSQRSTVNNCNEYQALKRDYESALQQEALYERGGRGFDQTSGSICR